ncbi:MAG: GxxExxY protein [Patescibacteria group bacterium]|nr:GxxExxY protein [Patescibacteria group bacterium]
MNYVDNRYYKSDITAKIIQGAYKVHNFLGTGFQEVIYQRALQLEFNELGLRFEREREMPIFYKELKIGERRVDFLVDGDIMVELKALSKLEDVHIAQLMNYIEAYKVKIGLLINFGAKKLEVKRFIK